MIDNVTGGDAIANLFATKYDELYSSVDYDVREMDDLKEYVADKLRSRHCTDDCTITTCLLYTSPSPRDGLLSRMPSSA